MVFAPHRHHGVALALRQAGKLLGSQCRIELLRRFEQQRLVGVGQNVRLPIEQKGKTLRRGLDAFDLVDHAVQMHIGTHHRLQLPA